MDFSIRALLACLAFYSGIYCIYFYFAQQAQPLLLLAPIVLWWFAYVITPDPHRHERRAYTATMLFGNFFWYPLITWWRLFIFPISIFLKWIYD